MKIGNKIRVPRGVVNALISVVVLLVLFVGAGVGYTWYVGNSGTTTAVAATPTGQTSEPVIKAHKPSPNAPESVAIESFTTPVQPGANSSMIVRTQPTSKCTISVMYGTIVSHDSGLVPKVADEFGTVSWSWTIGEDMPVGHAPVNVTCVYNQKSAVVQGDLVVTK